MLPDGVEQPANLRVPPNLAATGSQEIKPVLTVLLRAKSDALTGIKRADTANEKQSFRPAFQQMARVAFRIAGRRASESNDMQWQKFRGLAVDNVTIEPYYKFHAYACAFLVPAR